MTAPDRDIHRFIFETSAALRSTTDSDKLMRAYLRAAVEHFGAERGWFAVLEPGMTAAQALMVHPADASWNGDLATALLRRERDSPPEGTICARVTRRQRPWALLGLERDGGRFPEGAPRSARHVADEISERLARIDDARLAEVRARIDGKLMRELPPKDLYYQILDGLHLLTRYDHSAQLWIWNPTAATLELAAEQIAWRKSKSTAIGTKVTLSEPMQALLRDDAVHGFDRKDGTWRVWSGVDALALARLLDGALTEPADRPAAGAMLCAALGSRRGTLGVLVVSELHPGSFGPWERDIVARFTLLASIALQRAEALEMLQARMLKIERQSALAELARGVAHDINNALGEVIPLVQQIRADHSDRRLDPELLTEDLERIEHSLQVCRGIFGRMMRFARGSGRSGAVADVRRALGNAREVLADSLVKQRIDVSERVADGLAPVSCGMSDLERLFFNLISNARDAMASGGTLDLHARRSGELIEVVIADTGIGMDEDVLRQIERPFFTTKEHGTGLGLSTCRSIVSEAGGSLRIESVPGRGTTVTIALPIAAVGEAGEGIAAAAVEIEPAVIPVSIESDPTLLAPDPRATTPGSIPIDAGPR